MADTGDFDGSGVVDAADYTLWRNQLGQTGNNLSADGNHDQIVDQSDYALWKQQFGESVMGRGGQFGASENVPEPNAAAIAAILSLMLAGGIKLPRARTVLVD